eukprot:10171594-Alexandrium_andersonii.AAC.1
MIQVCDVLLARGAEMRTTNSRGRRVSASAHNDQFLWCGPHAHSLKEIKELLADNKTQAGGQGGINASRG